MCFNHVEEEDLPSYERYFVCETDKMGAAAADSQPIVVSDEDDCLTSIPWISNADADCGYEGDDGFDVCGAFPNHSYQVSRFHTMNEKLQALAMCVLCRTTQMQSMLLPCRHITLCESCANNVEACPLCGELIAGTIRIFVGFSLRER